MDQTAEVEQQDVEEFWQDKQDAQLQNVVNEHAADVPEESH